MAGYLDKDGAGIIAEKINELNKKNESKYTLPSDGIPETDLSQEVKDKLNSGGGGEQTYDTIISTQEEFEAWCAEIDAKTYTGSSVLILNGTYTRSGTKGLVLPDTLHTILGVGAVTITMESVSGNCIYYNKKPTDTNYSIENIRIVVSSAIGFYNCLNITNCRVDASGSEMPNSHFSNCVNLENCVATYEVSTTGSSFDKHCFYKCENLINCEGNCTVITGNTIFEECKRLTSCVATIDNLDSSNGSIGFFNCSQLVNCISTSHDQNAFAFDKCTNLAGCIGYATGRNHVTAFLKCTDLVNCSGYATGLTGSSCYTFETCSVCSNCAQDASTSSRTGTWAPDCTNVDPDTCPEYEGGGSSGGGGTQYYDTVIGSQEDFDAWCKELDAGTYAGHSVVLLHGTYTRSDGKGLHLPDTLYTVKGIGQVKIEITNFSYDSSSNKGGIWYTTTPTTKEYSIENISLSCTGSSNYGYGFYSCTNLTNCNGRGTGYGYGDGIGFYSCTNLTNCNGSGGRSGPGYGDGIGFYSCTNLTNCNGNGSGSGSGSGIGGGTGYGFHSCTNITNCNGNGSGSGSGYGFHSCTNITNCTGSGSGNSTGTVYGYGFHSCKICSNCRQDPDKSSTTATWGGTNANISKDTCPEYKV